MTERVTYSFSWNMHLFIPVGDGWVKRIHIFHLDTHYQTISWEKYTDLHTQDSAWVCTHQPWVLPISSIFVNTKGEKKFFFAL